MVLGLGGFVANLKANVRGFQVETHERVRWFSKWVFQSKLIRSVTFMAFLEQLRHQRYLRPSELGRGGAYLSIRSILA
jgi:hypothetical protein